MCSSFEWKIFPSYKDVMIRLQTLSSAANRIPCTKVVGHIVFVERMDKSVNEKWNDDLFGEVGGKEKISGLFQKIRLFPFDKICY